MDDTAQTRHPWRTAALLAVAVVCPLLLGRGMATYYQTLHTRLLDIDLPAPFLFDVPTVFLFGLVLGRLLAWVAQSWHVPRQTAILAGLLCGGLLFTAAYAFSYFDTWRHAFQDAVTQYHREQPTLTMAECRTRALSFMAPEPHLLRYIKDGGCRPDSVMWDNTVTTCGMFLYWAVLVAVTTVLTVREVAGESLLPLQSLPPAQRRRVWSGWRTAGCVGVVSVFASLLGWVMFRYFVILPARFVALRTAWPFVYEIPTVVFFGIMIAILLRRLGRALRLTRRTLIFVGILGSILPFVGVGTYVYLADYHRALVDATTLFQAEHYGYSLEESRLYAQSSVDAPTPIIGLFDTYDKSVAYLLLGYWGILAGLSIWFATRGVSRRGRSFRRSSDNSIEINGGGRDG